MDKFQVEIKFPRSSDPNPNVVTIIGLEENVLDAKEHIKALEDEYVSQSKILLICSITKTLL